jgi:hypothetical protein
MPKLSECCALALVALALVVRRERQPRYLVALGAIAVRTRRSGAAAVAGMRALPRSARVVLADPAAIIAPEALCHEMDRTFAYDRG